MRFLPTAEGKSRRLVLLTYTFAAIVSSILATISLVGVKILASRNSPLRLDMVESTAFVLAVAATAIFTIQDSVLVGLRRAVWVPAENGAFGVAKIGTLFVLAPIRSAFALFSAWMIPLTLTIPVISAVLFHRFLPPASRRRRAAPASKRMAPLGREMRSKITRFTVGDATGGLFTQAWMYLLPVVITAMLGAPINALYFTSFLFSGTIDQVAINYASPLTVEGAHTPHEIAALIRSTLRHVFVIILPVVAALIFICPWLLYTFGHKYVGGVPLLRLLLIACLPKAISAVYYAYCRVERTTYKSAIMQGYICIATLSSAFLLAHKFGLVGIGFAIMLVQTSAGAASSWALRRGLRTVEHSGHGRHRRRSRRYGPPEINNDNAISGG
jgi:O-antigen/teichoic acid export membrane protein